MQRFSTLFLLLLMIVFITAGCGATAETTTAPMQPTDTVPSDGTTEASTKTSDLAGANISDVFDKNAITAEMLNAANAYKDIYKTIEKKEYFNIAVIPTDNQMKEIVNRIGALGYSVVSTDINMQNPDVVEQFCQKAKAGENEQLGVYIVESDASLERYTFIVVNGKTYFTCIAVTWDTSDQPQVQYSGMVEAVDKFELTSKGYFLFHVPFIDMYEDSSYGFRVSPLPDENIELCKKYIEPIGYLGNNILTSNWNQETITELNYNDMYEYIYRMEYKKCLESDNYERYCSQIVNAIAVPATDFERIITKYFPISAQKLRQISVYDPDKNVYTWQEFMVPQYEPKPEVVAYQTNSDGSLTLTVDAVAIEYYDDCIFTDTLTVMPHEDGSFEYLSNSLKIFNSDCFPNYWPRVSKN